MRGPASPLLAGSVVSSTNERLRFQLSNRLDGNGLVPANPEASEALDELAEQRLVGVCESVAVELRPED